MVELGGRGSADRRAARAHGAGVDVVAGRAVARRPRPGRRPRRARPRPFARRAGRGRRSGWPPTSSSCSATSARRSWSGTRWAGCTGWSPRRAAGAGAGAGGGGHGRRLRGSVRRTPAPGSARCRRGGLRSPRCGRRSAGYGDYMIECVEERADGWALLADVAHTTEIAAEWAERALVGRAARGWRARRCSSRRGGRRAGGTDGGDGAADPGRPARACCPVRATWCTGTRRRPTARRVTDVARTSTVPHCGQTAMPVTLARTGVHGVQRGERGRGGRAVASTQCGSQVPGR